jgi:hypothetical protein
MLPISAIASLVKTELKLSGHPTYAQLVQQHPKLAKLVVALSAPGEAPPPTRIGYYSDGQEHIALAILSASGKRLFIEHSAGDVLSTNVAAHLFRGLRLTAKRVSRAGLARQARCFEGGGPVLMVIDVADLAVPGLELGVEANIDFDAAACTPGRDVQQGHDAVAFLDDLLKAQSMLIPCVEPSVSIRHRSLDATRGHAVLLDREPLDLRMQRVPEGVRVVLEGGNEAPHRLAAHLQVLVRHSPPSIPSRGA